MFTGIIECIGKITNLSSQQSNVEFWIQSPISHELHVDQSVSHDGVCLTIVEIKDDTYRVTAVLETLNRSTLGAWQIGAPINLERCIKADGRFDGHIVQGHVDGKAELTKVDEQGGSWKLFFKYEKGLGMTVEKGSICINGVSLTVVDSGDDSFSVVIIPYTHENTNLGKLKAGEFVNLEFDIVGKYIRKLMK